MKIKEEKKPEFTPFELTIIFENAEDVGKIYALFNHTAITEGLGIAREACEIRKYINNKGHSDSGDIFWKELDKAIGKWVMNK